MEEEGKGGEEGGGGSQGEEEEEEVCVCMCHGCLLVCENTHVQINNKCAEGFCHFRACMELSDTFFFVGVEVMSVRMKI